MSAARPHDIQWRAEGCDLALDFWAKTMPRQSCAICQRTIWSGLLKKWLTWRRCQWR